MTSSPVLKCPWPAIGGKSKVADLVWSRLGNVDNFIEPFCNSAAVLLRRPAEHFAAGYRTETINDAYHFVVNAWRAIKYAPDEVAYWADAMVTECELHAIHRWLMRSTHSQEWRKRMASDPEAYDAKIAGRYIFGACCWIGSGWCDGGVKRKLAEEMPQRPLLHEGNGVNVYGRPQLSDQFDIGRGVNASASTDHAKRIVIPDGGCGHGVNGVGPGVTPGTDLGTCDQRRAWLTDWMRRLADRFRLVRTCYGHWSRICDSDSTLTRLGTCGVFLDPPYPSHRSDNGKKSRDATLYATDKGADLNALRDEVLAWCRKWGQDPMIRVAVCGYEGDGYEALEQEGWSVESWEANGGYANQRRAGKGKSENAKRERIWFSPACIPVYDHTITGLFSGVES